MSGFSSMLSIFSSTESTERANWPSIVAKVWSRSRRTDLLRLIGGGISRTLWLKMAELLARTGAQGVNRNNEGVTNGTVTVIRAGQVRRPEVSPSKVSLHGNQYTASGVVVIRPEDKCRSVVVVARNILPPRCSSGCRLAQLPVGTWLRGNVS